MAGLKLAIFDVDGTLIDSLAHIKASMVTAFEGCGHPAPSEASVRGIIGLSLYEAVQTIQPTLRDAQIIQVVDGYKASFMKIRDETSADETAPMFPGALATLKSLHAQDEVLLAVATGKSRLGLIKMIEAHSLEGLFVSTQVADDHPSKPHPSMVDQCLRDTGVEPHNTVIIGDTTFDLEMGRSAGVKTIGVDWGYHDTDLLRPFADTIVEDFAALDPALNLLWRH
jgi:phosphoglycolate phosphatase